MACRTLIICTVLQVTWSVPLNVGMNVGGGGLGLEASGGGSVQLGGGNISLRKSLHGGLGSKSSGEVAGGLLGGVSGGVGGVGGKILGDLAQGVNGESSIGSENGLKFKAGTGFGVIPSFEFGVGGGMGGGSSGDMSGARKTNVETYKALDGGLDLGLSRNSETYSLPEKDGQGSLTLDFSRKLGLEGGIDISGGLSGGGEGKTSGNVDIGRQLGLNMNLDADRNIALKNGLNLDGSGSLASGRQVGLGLDVNSGVGDGGDGKVEGLISRISDAIKGSTGQNGEFNLGNLGVNDVESLASLGAGIDLNQLKALATALGVPTISGNLNFDGQGIRAVGANTNAENGVNVNLGTSGVSGAGLDIGQLATLSAALERAGGSLAVNANGEIVSGKPGVNIPYLPITSYLINRALQIGRVPLQFLKGGISSTANALSNSPVLGTSGSLNVKFPSTRGLSLRQLVPNLSARVGAGYDGSMDLTGAGGKGDISMGLGTGSGVSGSVDLASAALNRWKELFPKLSARVSSSNGGDGSIGVSTDGEAGTSGGISMGIGGGSGLTGSFGLGSGGLNSLKKFIPKLTGSVSGSIGGERSRGLSSAVELGTKGGPSEILGPQSEISGSNDLKSEFGTSGSTGLGLGSGISGSAGLGLGSGISGSAGLGLGSGISGSSGLGLGSESEISGSGSSRLGSGSGFVGGGSHASGMSKGSIGGMRVIKKHIGAGGAEVGNEGRHMGELGVESSTDHTYPSH